MSQPIPSDYFDGAQWPEGQLKRYGPIVGGEALRTFLGFRTYAAFKKARRFGGLEVSAFELRGRRETFAVTAEACTWLVAERRATSALTDYAQNECNKEAGSRRYSRAYEAEHGSP